MAEADAERWLRIAEGDLRAARVLIEADPPSVEQAAFYCQQAAEKMLKAVLVRRGFEPDRTHDLTRIARPAVRLEAALHAPVEPVLRLTEWAVVSRYPDAGELPVPEEAQVIAVLPQPDILLASVRAVLSAGDERA